MPESRRSPLMRILLTLLAILAVLYLAACAMVFFQQRSMIYYPQPAGGMSAERLTLAAEGAQVVVSLRRHDGPKALVYFGGNAEDVSANLPSLPAAFPDHAIYLMHYRGYGGSTGTPSEKALHQDALLLFDRVHARAPASHRDGAQPGQRPGGAAGQRAAGRAALVLVTPFESLSGLACCALSASAGALAARRQVRIGPLCAPRHGAHADHCGCERRSDSALEHRTAARPFFEWRRHPESDCRGTATIRFPEDPAYWRALRGDLSRAAQETSCIRSNPFSSCWSRSFPA